MTRTDEQTETMVRERPILFSGPMVRAILDGRKTQTRRVVQPQPVDGDRVEWFSNGWFVGRLRDSENALRPLRCPFGQPGDRLWVRETWKRNPNGGVWYRADPEWGESSYERGWKPSIHMPRASSRLTLDITDVRVERLRDISEADALAEGRHLLVGRSGYFPDTWDALNASRGYGWDANPWVWAITFRTVEGSSDAR